MIRESLTLFNGADTTAEVVCTGSTVRVDGSVLVFWNQ